MGTTAENVMRGRVKEASTESRRYAEARRQSSTNKSEADTNRADEKKNGLPTQCAKCLQRGKPPLKVVEERGMATVE